MELVPGVRLGPYELLVPLARGGMGSVWLGRLRRGHGFERLVAVKTVLPQYAEDERFHKMFLDEARVASRIHHANAAAIIDAGEHDHVLYLVMEWVEGESLLALHRLAEKRGELVPLAVSLRTIADACAAAHAAHEQRDPDGLPLNIVHRDISPQNIMVATSGVAKLIDFGIARARDRISGDTAAGTLKGKIRFAAPEQHRGGVVDRRADVWGLGATMRFLVTGDPPYPMPNELNVLTAILDRQPPAALPRTVPRPLARVLDRALRFEAGERYATALEMQRDIETAIAELELPASAAQVALYVEEIAMERVNARRQKMRRALQATTRTSGAAVTLPAPSELESRPPPPPELTSTDSANATVGSAVLSEHGAVTVTREQRRRNAFWLVAVAGTAMVIGAGLGRAMRTPPAPAILAPPVAAALPQATPVTATSASAPAPVESATAPQPTGKPAPLATSPEPRPAPSTPPPPKPIAIDPVPAKRMWVAKPPPAPRDAKARPAQAASPPPSTLNDEEAAAIEGRK